MLIQTDGDFIKIFPFIDDPGLTPAANYVAVTPDGKVQFERGAWTPEDVDKLYTAFQKAFRAAALRIEGVPLAEVQRRIEADQSNR